MTEPAIDINQLEKVLDNYEAGDVASLIEILHDVQSEYRYLPAMAMDHIAEFLAVTPARVYGVASFYEGFHLLPRGEHICTVCMGTACHVRGAPRILEQLERDLEVESGGTTDDLKFSLEEVNCVGACALGPLVIIDGEYHGNVKSSKLTKVVKKLKKEG